MTRYAETWTDIGRLPLRRRDRAAMVLALECLRDGNWHRSAIENVLKTGGVTLDLWAWVDDAHCSERDWPRLLRARLALLLRVLLRVDAEREAAETAGGAGPGYEWADCPSCDGVGWNPPDDLPPHVTSCSACDRVGAVSEPLRIRPLWETRP